LRLHPILSALLTVQDLYDFAEWYREASIPAHLQYNPTGLQCISYRAAIDNPSIACGFQYYAKRGNYGSGGCNTWHYQNQAIGGGNPMALGYAVGPLQGGIYGCQRLNFAYVLRYDTVPNANNANVAWIPEKAGFTRWMPSNAVPRVPLAVRSGYRPKPEPEPGELPRAPRPSPQDKPYEVPAMEYDPHKNGGRGVPVRHGQLPPNKKKGNKEKKGRDGIPRGFGVGAGLYGAATEFSDLADALYAGVPKSKRRPYQNPYEKAKAVWDNWDDIVGVTFLSLDDSFYQLLPYEAISKEQYNDMISKIPKINLSLLKKYETFEEFELMESDCKSNGCPVLAVAVRTVAGSGGIKTAAMASEIAA